MLPYESQNSFFAFVMNGDFDCHCLEAVHCFRCDGSFHIVILLTHEDKGLFPCSSVFLSFFL